MILTYRYRVKSKIGRLNTMGRAVNSVWNYCNDAQRHALKHSQQWPSRFDFIRKTSGSCRLLGIAADTISQVCTVFERSRRKARKPYLRYRGCKSLGWIPLRKTTFQITKEGVRYLGGLHKLGFSRPLPKDGKIIDGSSFAQDSRGRWFLNVALEVPDIDARMPQKAVGIDLGLKDIATLSTGEKISAPKFYRASEQKLAIAQRAKKTKRFKGIHAKITNRRKDFLHKLSTRITREFDLITIGGVNAKALARTTMAKSIHDAGWSTFRQMLAYKSIANGATFREVSEAYSTQACSDCGVIGGPKGRKGLVIREWRCECGSVHDRDVNAARNILRAGHSAPIAGAITA